MLTPGTDTYEIVIEAHAKVGDASKAEELLQRIEPKWLNETPSPGNKNDRFYPTSNLYKSVLAAWAFLGNQIAPGWPNLSLRRCPIYNEWVMTCG